MAQVSLMGGRADGTQNRGYAVAFRELEPLRPPQERALSLERFLEPQELDPALFSVGIGLHAYQDSWSHQTFDHVDGHGLAPLGGHAPDYPWYKPDRALAMAKGTYDKLEKLYKDLVDSGMREADSKDIKSWNDIKGQLIDLFKERDAAAILKKDWKRETAWRVRVWKNFVKQEYPTSPSGFFEWTFQPDQRLEPLFVDAAKAVTVPQDR